jgi:hypothetical protein
MKGVSESDSRILKAKSENARTAGGLLKESVSRVEVETESGGAKGKTSKATAGRNDAGIYKRHAIEYHFMEQH